MVDKVIMSEVVDALNMIFVEVAKLDDGEEVKEVSIGVARVVNEEDELWLEVARMVQGVQEVLMEEVIGVANYGV